MLMFVMANKSFKVFWLIIGFICLALGTIGVFLPVLPTVPFYLVTAFSFAKSSERLHNWFINTKLYKKNLESFVERKAMTLKTKLSILISVTLVMGFGFFMMARKGIWIPCIILAVVWLCHICYFMFRVKTEKTTDEEKVSAVPDRKETQKRRVCRYTDDSSLLQKESS